MSETEQGIFEQVLKGDLDFVSEPWPSISEGAKDLVRRMLVRDPTKRLTAHEVLCEYTCLIASSFSPKVHYIMCFWTLIAWLYAFVLMQATHGFKLMVLLLINLSILLF